MQNQENDSQESVSEEVVSDFKSLTRQMVHLIREAVGAATTMLVWVNHSRQQFVLAGSSTTKVNTLFQDRTPFNEHFLHPYQQLTQSLLLNVDKHLTRLELDHYFNGVPIDYVGLFPIVSQGETIALFVCDFEHEPQSDILKRCERHVQTYARVLNNYMQLTELQRDEETWAEHDTELDGLVNEADEIKATIAACDQIAQASKAERVLFVAQHNSKWTCIHQIDQDLNLNPDLLGAIVAEDSFVMDTLQAGESSLVVQNENRPRLLHIRENLQGYSCLAIPLNLKSRRQGIFLIADKNPYLINDIKRHKIKDVVRVLSLRLQITLTDSFKAYLCNTHDMVSDAWLESLTKYEKQLPLPFIALFSLKNIANFKVNRTNSIINKLRQDLVDTLMPFHAGLSGLTTEHADFVYESMIWNTTEAELLDWKNTISNKLVTVFSNYFPQGTEKPQLQMRFKQLKLTEDWLQQKRSLL